MTLPQCWPTQVTQSTTQPTTLHLHVETLHATGIRLSLTLTAADGRGQVITRAMSASDTTISAKMRHDFLWRLFAAIPPDCSSERILYVHPLRRIAAL